VVNSLGIVPPPYALLLVTLSPVIGAASAFCAYKRPSVKMVLCKLVEMFGALLHDALARGVRAGAPKSVTAKLELIFDSLGRVRRVDGTELGA
jgi:hypothetical protein